MKVRPYSGTGYLDEALSIEESKEVFAHFGLAVHASNVVEFAILNALFAIDVLPNIRTFTNKASWEHEYDKFFDAGLSQTFGKLVGRLKKRGKYTSDLIETLEACTTVRNYLVHHSQREGAAEIFSKAGRDALIKSYENAVSLFEAANDQIEAEIREQHNTIGIDTSWLANRIDSAMQELVSRAAQ